MKEEIDNQDFIKIKNVCSVKTASREWKGKPQTRKKFCKTHIWWRTLIYKELFNFNNKKTTQLEIGRKIWIYTSPKKIKRWPMSKWKDAHLKLEKFNLKKWEILILILEWLKFLKTWKYQLLARMYSNRKLSILVVFF